MNSSSFNFFYNIQRFVLFKRLIIGYSNIRIIIFFIFIYFKMISYYNYINIAWIIYIKNLFFSLFFFANIIINNFFVFLFITLRVAEARVGISLLTILVRVHGEDVILTLTV